MENNPTTVAEPRLTATTTPDLHAKGIRTLQVMKVTPIKRKSDGKLLGYKTKLQTQTTSEVPTEFGMSVVTKQETYYLDLATAPEIGKTANLDLNLFRISEDEFTPEEGENAGQTMMLKNLRHKS